MGRIGHRRVGGATVESVMPKILEKHFVVDRKTIDICLRLGIFDKFGDQVFFGGVKVCPKTTDRGSCD